MSRKYVFFRYAWRGSLIPIVTIFGIDLGSLLGGAMITELTFSLPGHRPARGRVRAQQRPAAC